MSSSLQVVLFKQMTFLTLPVTIKLITFAFFFMIFGVYEGFDGRKGKHTYT